MKKIKFLLISLFLISTIQSTQAQTDNDSLAISFKPYASFRGHLAVYDNEIALQENVSRVGAKIGIKKGNLTFLAATELHLSLFQGGASFNVDGNENTDFLDVTTVKNNQAFTNRIGYIGFDFEKYGTLTFGKQWSVYYDVASYTDQFTIFGGRASATYIGGTDGGSSGTGRANQSVIYRNQFGDFYLGAQAQVRGGGNNHFIDGFGFSAQYQIVKKIFVGASFNRAFLSNELINQHRIIGLDGQPTYYSAGIKYLGEKLTLSVLGAIEKNGDFSQGAYFNSNNDLINPTVVFNAKGFEFFANYQFKDFSVHGGYNLYVPDRKKIQTENNQIPVSSNFKVNDVIFGLNYQPLKFIQVYAEQRLSFGRNALNVKDQSVFAVGMKIDVSKTFNTKINAK